MGSSSPLVVVAGATGHAGRAIVSALKAHGARVRALVRNPDRLQEVRSLCDEIRVVEVTRAGTLRGVMDGGSALVSAVGKTNQNDPVSRHRVDVAANIHLFDEARRAGLGRIAFISVLGADLSNPAVLAQMKAEAEAALRSTGVPYAIVRPTGYFTDMWAFMEMARHGQLFLLGDGLGTMNPIHPLDLGDYVAAMLLDETRVDETVSIGGPEVFEMRALPALCERVLGKKVRVRKLPRWMASGALQVLRVFSRDRWEVAQSLIEGVLSDRAMVGERTGTRRLEDYFRARMASGDAADLA